MRIGLLLITIFIFIATTNAQNKSAVSKQKKDSVSNDLREVVVTGEFQPQSLKNSVYRTRVINAERIRLKAATSIQQVLNTELGFRFSNDLTLGTTDVQMMGMSGRSVKILLDGVPMIDRGDARESLDQIDVNTIERIEIVEGPLSVSYGSDALVGVINVITKRAGKESLNINARVQEETAGNEYSPFGKSGKHSQHAGGSWQNKGWSVLAGLTRDEFNGFNVPGPTVIAENISPTYWKPKLKWMGNGKLGYRNDNFNMSYRFDYLDENIDSRGGYLKALNQSLRQQYITNRYIHVLQGDYRWNEKIQLSGSVAYNNLKRATKTVLHNYATGRDSLTAEQGQQDIAKFNTFALRTVLVYKMSDQISFQPGIEINRDGANGARIAGKPTISDYAFFISSELNLAKGFTLRPGLRFIKNSVYDAPPVVPTLNAKISLTDQLDLRLGYASGFRAPALRELYYDFRDSNHTILGNTNLKAEQSNNYTASLSFSGVETAGFSFKSVLSGYYNNIKNRIDLLTSATDITAATLVNVSKFKTTAGTLENTLIWKNVQATLGFSMLGTYNVLSENSSQLGETPQFVWSPEINTNLSYYFPELGATANLSAKFNGTRRNYESYIDKVDNLEKVRLAKVGSFTLLDLMLSKKIFKTLTLNAGVNNLLNVTTLSNTSLGSGGAHSSTGAPVPMGYGRSYVVGLSFNWSKD
ncbi:outer membrane receptor for ferrienterochelin and colicins [Pedobacter cryoconitis]|uniref:Outer membrane receptor for ferrienterochelin and colicins n=1 Tax=Pedobacter cryoconitis TaxID=188932 RepID=A0A7W8ZIY7_9SPHI|nr:TonB-dependent receptor [Pedobacter cryoconitis]MBB5634856.1 outer membrane receptor for ferrienterochelin and colicins [Pedobacter cryoconitis]